MTDIVYIGILLASVLMSSVSQAMLKASSNKTYETRIAEYMNPLVVGAYALLFLSTLLVVISLKVLPLTLLPLFEALGYVFVTAIGIVAFKEHVSCRKAIGILAIIAGVLIATL